MPEFGKQYCMFVMRLRTKGKIDSDVNISKTNGFLKTL